MKISEAIEKLTVKRDDALHFQKMYAPGEFGWTGNESKAIAYSTAINVLEQLDEPQAEKVEIIERQAQLLEAYEGETLYALLGECNEYEQELLAKARLFGYTVKPKRWAVKTTKLNGMYFRGVAGVSTDGEFSYQWAEPKGCVKFTDRAKAEAVAVLVDGSVEEV